MEKKTVDVIIPAYRPGEGWKQMLRGLEGQTWPVHRLIVMNTGKEKWKAAYEKTTIPMEVHHLTREEFDHGKTRDQAARMSRADYLLFMTQDALPEDCHLIEKLVEAMERDEKIGAAYARQLPREDCRLMEQYTRQFNYPEESRGEMAGRPAGTRYQDVFLFQCVCNVQTGAVSAVGWFCTEGHF